LQHKSVTLRLFSLSLFNIIITKDWISPLFFLLVKLRLSVFRTTIARGVCIVDSKPAVSSAVSSAVPTTTSSSHGRNNTDVQLTETMSQKFHSRLAFGSTHQKNGNRSTASIEDVNKQLH
jgi:hypothetical protein